MVTIAPLTGHFMEFLLMMRSLQIETHTIHLRIAQLLLLLSSLNSSFLSVNGWWKIKYELDSQMPNFWPLSAHSSFLHPSLAPPWMISTNHFSFRAVSFRTRILFQALKPLGQIQKVTERSRGTEDEYLLSFGCFAVEIHLVMPNFQLSFITSAIP